MSLDERAAFVSKVLGKAGELLHKDCPFLWQSSDNIKSTMEDGGLEEPKKVSNDSNKTRGIRRPLPKGIFLGRKVLKTLAEHIILVLSVLFGQAGVYEVSTKPRGSCYR